MRVICPYCGRDFDVEDLTDEHVIPQKMGGNLIIDACGPCNHGSAHHVDNPLMRDGDVRVLRAIYDVRSPKHRTRRAGDQIVGHLARGGGRALWRPGPDDVLEQVTPSDPVLEGDGSFTVTTPVRDHQKHLERVLAHMRAANPGKTVTLERSERRTGDVVFEHSWNIAPWVWPRFFAKVALALGHEAIPSFDTSITAGMLRGLFRLGKTYKGMFPPGIELGVVPTALDESDIEPNLLLPHEHLLALVAGEARLTFGGILFGELRYAITVASDLVPPERAVGWLLDGEGEPIRAPLGTLTGWLALRADEFGGTRRFRTDRPCRQFRGQVHRGNTS